jgi:N-acetylglutamate synthase-like GNAT family acetyltransferase
VGTLISSVPFDQLRPATIGDVGGILGLIEPLEAEGVLVKRSREKLEREIDRFQVMVRDGATVACGAVYPYRDDGMAELACIAVDPDYRRSGYGAVLLDALERSAELAGLREVFVLTTQTTHWFQERGYVKKEDVNGRKLECIDYELEEDTISEKKTTREVGNEKNKLVIQQLGIIVMEFLDKHFNSLFNYDYTRLMEDDLDKISKGEKEWTLLCDSCLKTMEESCKELKNEKKHEIRIDENHSYIIGKFGPVIKCVEGKDEQGKDKVVFKPIKKDINLEVLERGGYKLEDLLDNDVKKKGDTPLGKFHGEDLFIKKGKYGVYANWGENNKSLSCFGNRPIQNITYDEVLAILMKDELDGNLGKKGPNIIREITSNISIRNSAHGDYLFFKTAKMKKPVFYKLTGFKGDYKNCNIEILKSWIIDEHKIRI